MNKIEQKIFDFAQSVGWSDKMISDYIDDTSFPYSDYLELEGDDFEEKISIFIEKHKPKDNVGWYRIDNEIPKIDHSCKDADSSIFGDKPVKDIKLSDFFPKPAMVTLPIEDYNHLRILELKHEIKKLKKELKSITK